MKITTKYILGLIAILAVIIACTKEVGLYTEVEFEISETHVADGFINTPLATSITVTPEELVEGYSYSYSYKINSGEGYFEDESGTTIAEGDKIGLNPLSAALNYIATKIGDHSITFTAEDTFGFTEAVTLTYTITNVPVTWTATGPSGQVLLGTSQDITVILGSETTATGVTYERNYSFTQGTGTITSSPSGPSETLNEFVSITPGTFTLTYVATELGQTTLEFLLKDSNGQEILQTVSFEVVDELDTTAPVITLIGGDISLVVGETYTDEGATANDDVDGDITDNIVIVNPVNTNVPGTYILTYSVTDAAGNDAIPVTRTVTITNDDQDSVKPVITLIGDDVTITVGDTYTDQGATANDDVDGDITGEISIVNLVDPTVADTYTVTYNVTDAAGNSAEEVIRTVVVNQIPVAEAFNLDVDVNSENNIIDVSGYISDLDNDNLTVSILSNTPENGTVTINGTEILYTPTNNYIGGDEIVYIVSDGFEEVEATIFISVIELPNQPPIAVADNYSVIKGTNNNLFNVIANDSDPDGDTLTVTLELFPLNGTATMSGNQVSYSPNINFVGTDQIGYQISDGNGGMASGSITVTVTGPTNQAPTAVATGPTATITGVVENFYADSSSDPDGDNLTYLWDFGDTTTSNLINPTHSYTTVGTYTVTLTVTDNGIPVLSDSESIIINVTGATSTATFSNSQLVREIYPSVTGTLIIPTGSPISFKLSVGAGTDVTCIVTFTIQGVDSWTLTVDDDFVKEINTTVIPPGVYTYYLSGTFDGSSAAFGEVTIN